MKISELFCSRSNFAISVLVFTLLSVFALSVAALAQTTTIHTDTTHAPDTTTTTAAPATTVAPTTTTAAPTTTYSGVTTTYGTGVTSTTYYTGPSTTYTMSNFCGEGPIPASGCSCGGATYTSGYCCAHVYQATYCTHTGTSGTSYTTTTYYSGGGTKSDGSSCSLNNECRSNFCSGGTCSSTAPGYPGTTYAAPPAQCSSGTPWYCYSESDCKNVGMNWCKSSSGSGQCTSASPCPYTGGTGTTPQPTYQQCEQKSVSAVDDANHCSFYRSPCDVPPGWKIVDKCPEFKPREDLKQPLPPERRQTVPEGCHEEQDPYGGIRVICPQKVECPTLDNEQQQKEKCKTDGGNPLIFKDRNGCNTMQCQFGSSQDLTYGGGGFTRPLACPQKSQIDADAEKCEKFGGKPVMKTVSGCVYADCLTGGTVEREKEKRCPPGLLSAPERERCEGSGGRLAQIFDEKGCQIQKCSRGLECEKVPEEAYTKCSEDGGQLVVRNNNRGCAEFVKCVKKGTSSDIEYERIDEVPDTSKLLQLALKLESIKIEMDKLAEKTQALADYWEGAGNKKEQKRFERVTGMLKAAEDKIDEIKDRMSKKVQGGGVKANHVLEFKHDLKYIKDVVFENVLYVMLSAEGADSKLTERSDVTEAQARGENVDCGSNGMCFDENVRSCTPSSFHPETFVNVVIGGIDGESCSIRVEMTPPIPGQTKTYVADCKYDKYVFGMTGPDDLIPTCTGDGVELMKKFANEGAGGASGGPGGPGGRGRPSEGFAGPGGCTNDQECRDYCYEHFDECKKFSQQRGFEKDFKEEYQRQSEQYSSGGYGPPPGYGGEGGYGPPGFSGGYPAGGPGGFPAGGGFPQQPGGFPQGGYPAGGGAPPRGGTPAGGFPAGP